MDDTGERELGQTFSHVALEHLHRYAMARELSQGKRVMDIACGTGYGSRLLAQNATAVTGVDIDAASIAYAQKNYSANNVTFKQGSATDIPMEDQCIDLVVSFETLEHFAAQEAFIKEIKRVLLPGGIVIISTPDKSNFNASIHPQTNPHHIKELSTDEFKDLMGSHFKYHKVFLQTITMSLITPASELAGEMPEYHGDFNAIHKKGLDQRAPYRIIVASDEPITFIHSSAFAPTRPFEQLIRPIWGKRKMWILEVMDAIRSVFVSK